MDNEEVWLQQEKAHLEELRMLQQLELASKRREKLVSMKAEITAQRHTAFIEDWKVRLEEKERAGRQKTDTSNETMRERH